VSYASLMLAGKGIFRSKVVAPGDADHVVAGDEEAKERHLPLRVAAAAVEE
jgi:hypothetical protein